MRISLFTLFDTSRSLSLADVIVGNISNTSLTICATFSIFFISLKDLTDLSVHIKGAPSTISKLKLSWRRPKSKAGILILISFPNSAPIDPKRFGRVSKRDFKGVMSSPLRLGDGHV